MDCRVLLNEKRWTMRSRRFMSACDALLFTKSRSAVEAEWFFFFRENAFYKMDQAA